MTSENHRARLSLVLSSLDAVVSAHGFRDPVPGFGEVSRIVSAAASGVDLGVRRRHELRTAVSHVGVYLRIFCPASPATALVSDEAVLWSTPDTRIADLLVLSGPEAAVVTTPLRAVGRRLLAGEADVVRFCKLTAPLRSLLSVDPSSPPQSLASSQYWFGLEGCSRRDVFAVVGGER